MVSDEQLSVIFGSVSLNPPLEGNWLISATAWQPENVILQGLFDNRVTIVQQ